MLPRSSALCTGDHKGSLLEHELGCTAVAAADDGVTGAATAAADARFGAAANKNGSVTADVPMQLHN